MTLDEMSAQGLAGRQCRLEIYRTIAAKLFQVRALDRFLKEIEREFVPAFCGDRQTATVNRHAIADGNFRRELRRSELQLSAAVFLFNRYHATDFLDQASKHSTIFSAGWG